MWTPYAAAFAETGRIARAAGGSRAQALLIALYGAYALVKRQIIDYMVLSIPFVYFDFSEPLILFLLDYASVILLLIVLGCCAMRAMKAVAARRRDD